MFIGANFQGGTVNPNRLFRPEVDSLPPYESGKPISEVKAELKLEEVIKLASNESPYPPFPQAMEAMKGVLSELNRYPDAGCAVLRRKLADFLQVPEKNIMVGNGSNELEQLLAMAVLNPGDEVIMADITFLLYTTVTKLMGGVCRKVPLRDFRHDLKAMLAQINERTKMVFICNPNNPTGTIVYEEEVEEFLEKVPSHVLVVFDEAYSEFVEDARYPQGLKYFRQGKNVVILRSFSKMYSMAGCRIGYGVSSLEVVEAVNKVRVPFAVNTLAQAAAVASLDCQDEVARRKKLNSEGKQYLYQELRQLGVKYIPTEANFVFMDVGQSGRAIFEKLLRHGVIVRTGDIFGYDTGIRVSIGTPEENRKFIRALDAVLKSSEK